MTTATFATAAAGTDAAATRRRRRLRSRHELLAHGRRAHAGSPRSLAAFRGLGGGGPSAGSHCGHAVRGRGTDVAPHGPARAVADHLDCRRPRRSASESTSAPSNGRARAAGAPAVRGGRGRRRRRPRRRGPAGRGVVARLRRRPRCPARPSTRCAGRGWLRARHPLLMDAVEDGSVRRAKATIRLSTPPPVLGAVLSALDASDADGSAPRRSERWPGRSDRRPRGHHATVTFGRSCSWWAFVVLSSRCAAPARRAANDGSPP